MHCIRIGMAALLAAIVLAACTQANSAAEANPAEGALPKLGMVTSLPILWFEGDDFSAILSGDEEPHWARTAIEAEYKIVPLDVIEPRDLAALDVLVLAQPRMLAPQENVALDDWVRDGGRVLIFADPMLTGHSQYGSGDRRRPQDVVLLDAILARWGLELSPSIPQLEVASVPLGEGRLPYLAEGRLSRRPPAGGGEAVCDLQFGGLLAQCAIGAGRAVLVADATLLEDTHGIEPGAREAFDALLGMVGEPTGK